MASSHPRLESDYEGVHHLDKEGNEACVVETERSCLDMAVQLEIEKVGGRGGLGYCAGGSDDDMGGDYSGRENQPYASKMDR